MKRQQIIPSGAGALLGEDDQVLKIPELYLKEFRNEPEKALRDLAGIPPAVGDPFISLAYKTEQARERWQAKHPGLDGPLSPTNKVAQWFRATDRLKRVAHIDMAYSGQGDALGFAMGHVREVVLIEGEYKPYIVMDLLMRIKAPGGGEIFIGDIRRFIYDLKAKDKYNFNLVKVTMDGFQSTDTMQQLARNRIESELVSVDKDMLPYYDLREALYEDRIEFPPYYSNLRVGDESSQVEIVIKEMSELVDNVRKIDHPDGGSKDVADAVAGCVYTLMGDRKFRKNVISLETARMKRASGDGLMATHHAYVGDQGLTAPMPPSLVPSWNGEYPGG